MKTEPCHGPPTEVHSRSEIVMSTHRLRQNSSLLNQKLQRSTKSGANDFLLSRKTVGIWKTKNRQRIYVSLKGEELTGAAARQASEIDDRARNNRCASLNQEYTIDDPTCLSYWRIPKEIQQIYSSNGVHSLYNWQAEALSQPGVADGTRNFIFSTPTSSGKSLIAELLLIRHLLFQQKKCIIILPYVSLVEEKFLDLKFKLSPIGGVCKAFHSNIAPVLTDEVDVAICTIEKASLMLNTLITSRRLGLITSVIIDELHYISDPQRGHLLETTIAKMLFVKRCWSLPFQIVGMSATLPNFAKVADWLNAVYYSSDYRPVPLHQHYVMENGIYNHMHQRLRSFHSNLDNTAITVALVKEVLQNHHSAIVFVATKAWSVNLMLTLAQRLEVAADPRRNELLDKMRIELHGPVCPKLEFGILKGIAYHNSDLPPPIRRLIENGFRSRVINCLCATSTVAAGVNLPARRVIFRSQYVGRQLLSVAQYQQMAGRAGRANLDELGESFLLCDGSSKEMKDKVQEIISAPVSPICSNLIFQNDTERVVRFVLDGICLHLCENLSSIQILISCTLWAALELCHDTLLSMAEKSISYLLEQKFVQQAGDRYAALKLGQATCASGFSCSDALIVYETLDQARLRLCTASPLQLAYLSTPLQSPFHLAGNLTLQQRTMESLNSVEQSIASSVGVDPFFTFKSVGVTLPLDSATNPGMRKQRRLILAKLLVELIEGEATIPSLSIKYKVAPGDVQNLQSMSATMANMSSVFCQHLRWDCLALLLARFTQLLSFGCSDHLLQLFTIPNMTVFWANTLYSNHYQTPEDIASANLEDIVAALQSSASEKTYLRADHIRSLAESIYKTCLAIRNHRLSDPTTVYDKPE